MGWSGYDRGMPDSELRTEMDGRPLTLTNLDKVLFPSGFTKAEVIDHYLRVAPVMLPHLQGRCITRLRFPNGTAQASFYEKNIPAGAPEWVTTQEVLASDSTISYVVADSPATLVWFSNLAALELHTPQWRAQDCLVDGHRPTPDEPISIEDPEQVRCDRVVVDLDPGPGITMVESAQAAMIFATALAQDGLIPFVKTSGSKGLQLFAPIHPARWRDVLAYVSALGKRVATQHPDRFVTTMAKDARAGRIYIDALQNRADRNTIAPWSLRGKDFASVSTPLTWEEVAAVDAPDALRFDSATVLARLEADADPWADLLDPATAGQLPQPPA